MTDQLSRDVALYSWLDALKWSKVPFTEAYLAERAGVTQARAHQACAEYARRKELKVVALWGRGKPPPKERGTSWIGNARKVRSK